MTVPDALPVHDRSAAMAYGVVDGWGRPTGFYLFDLYDDQAALDVR